jgi:hypothetical protein
MEILEIVDASLRSAARAGDDLQYSDYAAYCIYMSLVSYKWARKV